MRNHRNHRHLRECLSRADADTPRNLRPLPHGLPEAPSIGGKVPLP